jgi:hypothetical protein
MDRIRSAGEGARVRASEALKGGLATSVTEERGALTGRTQRQGAQVLTDGPGHRTCGREAVFRDLGRVIKIGRGRSKPGGLVSCGRRRSSSRR